MLPNVEDGNCYKKAGKQNVTKPEKIKLIQNLKEKK